MIHAEKMRPEDFPFAIKLTDPIEWNMTESDFEFMLELEPDGCFVLLDTEERIGITTCINYGKTGWIGNVAVKEDHQRKGAGTFLVKHASRYLRDNGVETIGLYAYKHLTKFYEDIGFKKHDDFAVLSGKTSAIPSGAKVTKAKADNFPALIELSKHCLGDSRRKLLRALLINDNNTCLLASENNHIVGFVIGKNYGAMAEIGPLICRQNTTGIEETLIKAIISKLNNLEVIVCAPTKGKIIDSLKTSGLEEKFRVTRMFLGPVAPQSCVYVPESLERG